MSDDSIDRGAGYKKPPESGKFRKGNQAAKRKRRKTAEPADHREILDSILSEQISAKIRGESRRVSVQEALLMRLSQEALEGKAWAADLFDKLSVLVPIKAKPWKNPMDHDAAIREIEQRLADLNPSPESDDTTEAKSP